MVLNMFVPFVFLFCRTGSIARTFVAQVKTNRGEEAYNPDGIVPRAVTVAASFTPGRR